MTEIAPRQENGTPANNVDLGSLHFLSMAPLPFERRALRRMRMIKNMRLDTVIELFAANLTGSGQATIKNIANDFEVYPGPDLSLLRLLEALPSFDQYSLRINLRGSEFVTPAEFDRKEWQYNLLDQTLSDFVAPLAQRVIPQEFLPLLYNDVLRRLRDDEGIRETLDIHAKTFDSDRDTVIHFLEDYADTVLSLSFYRQCLNQMMPPIEDMLRSVRELRVACVKRDDALQLATLNIVEATVNEMIAEVTGRIESFERSTRDIWVSMDQKKCAQLAGKCRDYQASIANIICALAVKMNRWIQVFPSPNVGTPARRSGFILSEMRQGMEHIRELLGAVPIMAEGAAP